MSKRPQARFKERVSAFSRAVSFYMRPEVARGLKVKAAMEGVTVQSLLDRIASDYIGVDPHDARAAAS